MCPGMMTYQKEQTLEIKDWVQIAMHISKLSLGFLLNDPRVSACPLIKQKDNTIDVRVVLTYSPPLNMGLNCAGPIMPRSF